jgi:ribosomal protein L6P/L9E
MWKEVLRLKGLGFRVNYSSEDQKNITLKLGYTHLINVTLPNNIKTNIRKKRITIYSANKTKLGDFARKIYNYKIADIYKGKGFYYKYKYVRQKQIKKK